MKFRDLEKFVGFKDKGLKQRAKALGYEFNLDNDLTVFQASELLEKLPACKSLKVYFGKQGLPEIELIGAWTLRDWNRVQAAVPRAMATRRREFADACAPKPQTVRKDKGVVEDVARPNESTEPVPATEPTGADVLPGLEQPNGADGPSNLGDGRKSEAVERNGSADIGQSAA